MAESTSNLSPLAFLTARLRDAAGGGEIVITAMINQALSFLHEETDEAERAARASELAFSLAEVLESGSDNATNKKVFKALLDLGAAGEVLGFLYVGGKTSSPEEMGQALSQLSPKEQLIVLNRFFMLPRAVEPHILEAASDRVKDIAGQDPEEVLLFLEHLAESGRKPALPVQWELQRGQFGVWLDELMKLELISEQASYMARTAGLLASPRITENLARLLAGGDHEDAALVIEAAIHSGSVSRESPEKIVRGYLKHHEYGIRRKAAQAMIELGSPAAAKALGLLLQRLPKDKAGLLPLALTLWGDDFKTLTGLLPEQSRTEDLWALARLAAEKDNSGFKSALAMLAGDENPPATAAIEELEKLADEFAGTRPKPAYVLPDLVRLPPEEEQREGLFGKVRRKVKEIAGKDENGLPGRALAEIEPGGMLVRMLVENADLAGIELENNKFDSTSFRSLILAASRIGACRFNSCRISSVDFRDSELESVVFRDCLFEHCVFTGARIGSGTFARCAFKGCYFGQSGMTGTSVLESTFIQCDFFGARLSGVKVQSCSFSASNFSWAHLTKSGFKGVSWRDCIFERTLFEDSDLSGSVFQIGVFADCGFAGAVFDDPELHAARRLSLNERLLRNTAKPSALPQVLSNAEGAKALSRVLDQWFFERDARRREELVLAQNRRRMHWAISKWGIQAAEFVKLLPLLLATGSAVPKGKAQAPACRLPGYFPDYDALRLAEKYLGLKEPFGSAPDETVDVEGLYSIGSVGTIAQNRNSDLDLWLCYEPGTLEGEKLEAVEARIADIEEWAARQFGLEVHFFVMDIESVRQNDFGFSDKESAGSAQAKLLKEEFYRTVVLMAGKKPVWWFVPPGASNERYSSVMKRLTALPYFGKGVLADLGHLDKVPKEEFFGASLWQIVKALKRPFKSVMKFAVLDRYFASEETGALFCDSIKANLFAGARSLWDVDAYGVLFREVYEFYERAGNKEAMDLMLRAFRQKTRFNLDGRTTGKAFEMTGASFMEYFFPLSSSRVERDIAPAVGASANGDYRPGFADMITTGRKVSGFIFSTYESVSDKLASENLEAQVSREDMTKLFRKIFAGFKQKQDKIMLVPFVDPPRGLYTTLDIQCTGKQGEKPMWVVLGRRSGKFDADKDALEEIGRDHHPVRLAAWIVANGLYKPEIPVRGGNLQKPLSLPDLTGLLEALSAFFPHEETFNTDIEENLNNEYAVKVFTSVNLMALREEKDYREAQVVYSTNWGEMFCLTSPKGLDLLKGDPMNFVRANVPLAKDRDVATMFHLPHKARCPKLM